MAVQKKVAQTNATKPKKDESLTDTKEIEIMQPKEDVISQEAIDFKNELAEQIAELRSLKRDIEARASKLVPEAQYNSPKGKVISPLKDKIVKISPIQKPVNDSIKDASEATMLTKTSRTVVVPVDERGNLVNPLTENERLFFEETLKVDLNHLVTDPKKNFWCTRNATLLFKKSTRDLASATLTLDLSKPYDYILYKVALSSPSIANSWKERYENAEYDFVIEDEIDKLSEELEFTEIEDTVNEALLSNKHHKKYLFDLLRMYGSEKVTRHITMNTETEILYTELKRLARNKKDLLGLHGIISMDKEVLYQQIFVEDGISTGFIEVRGNEYKLKGGQTIAYSKDEAIAYFTNPENQSLKLQLQAQIKNTLSKSFQ